MDVSQTEIAEELQNMVLTKKIRFGRYESVELINKAQRYACIRRLFTSGRAVDDLVQLEKSRDYSDDDEMQAIKLRAANPDHAAKEALWRDYLEKGKFKQKELLAST